MSSAISDLDRVAAPLWPLERPPADFGLALAPPLTSLIGREQDIDAVANLLLGAARCVTLTGPGGVGKTRLALAVAAELFPSLRHGVYCVPLALVDDPGRVPDAIALALGVGDRPGTDIGESIAGWLRDREVMLLLDNFEHLPGAAPLVQDLMQRCPRLVCLVTSRSPLRISGEQVVQVAPLPLPPVDSSTQATARLDEIAGSPAIQLFVQRARAADTRFAFSETTAHPVAENVRRLDGLPLAIELAAAHVQVLTPAAMLARMDRRLHFLGGGPADQPARLQTMRQTIGWSYDLLSPDAQRFFRALSIFIGGATIEACEAILPNTGAGPVVANLRELVDQQLIQRIDDPGGDSRFVMLQTVLAFGVEQLENAGEREEIARRHAVYFVDLAERLEPEFPGPQQRECLTLVDHELPNFRAARTWLIERGDAEAALRMASALAKAWLVRGRASEGIVWIEGALAELGDAVTVHRAHGLASLSSLFFVRGDFDQAIACCDEVIAIARQIDVERDLGTVLTNLGCVANHRGQTEEALRSWEEALVVQRRRNDRDGIAALQNNAGIVNVAIGDLARARVQLSEAYRIRQAAGSPASLALVVFNLSQLANEEGDTAAVRPLLERSLELCRSVNDIRGVGWAYVGLGLYFHGQGDSAAAVNAFLDGLILSEQAGDTHNIFYCLDGLATESLARGNAVLAAKLHGYLAWLRRSAGAEVQDYDRAALDEELTAIRSKLSETEFASAWANGELMQISDVVGEVARGILPPVEPAAIEGDLVVASDTPALSSRELEVLRRVVDGRSDREVSEELFISRKTASNHVAAILRKFGVPNRAAAVTFAHRHRMV